MQNWLQKHKHAVRMCLLALTVVGVFGLTRVFVLPGLSLKTQTTKFNTVTDGTYLSLQNGESVSQSFVTDRPLYSIAVLPNNERCAKNVSLTGVLQNAAGETLATAQTEMQGFQNETYIALAFDTPVESKGEQLYTFTVTAVLAEGDTLRLARSADAQSGMDTLLVNGRAARGSLTMTAETGRVNGFITPFFLVLTALCAGTACFLYAAVFVFKWPLPRVYLAAVLLLGLLYMLVFPPYASTDERQHINQAFNNAARITDNPDIPWGITYKRACDSNSLIEENATTVFTYREIAENFFTAAPDDTLQRYNTEEVYGYSVPYALSTLGVLVGRLLRWGYVPTLYFARLLNLLFFAAVTYLAVRLAPFGQAVFACVCLLPVTLHVGASFSRDSFVLAMFFLFTSLCLRMAYGEGRVTARQVLVLTAVAALACPAKVAYVPFVLLVLILPAARFADKAHAWGCKLGVLGVSLLSYLCVNAAYVQNTVSGPSAAAAEAALTAGTNPDLVTYDIAYFLGNPVKSLSLLVNTVTEHGAELVRGVIGGNLGNANTELSWVFVLAFAMVLFIAAQIGDGVPLRRKETAVPAAVAVLGCAALVVAGCVLWTPTYYTAIYGLQGRYFLPMLPLCLLFCKLRRVQAEQALAGRLVLTCGVLQAFTLLNAFVVIANR